MTKEEIAKYLSNISDIKETVLDNFKYKDSVSDIMKEDLKKYNDLYKSYEQASLSSLLGNFDDSRVAQQKKELENIYKLNVAGTFHQPMIDTISKQQEELAKVYQSTLASTGIFNQTMIDDISKQQEELAKVYQSILASTASTGLFNQTMIDDISEQQEELNKVYKTTLATVIKPTLPEELLSLNSQYNNQFDKWKEELDKLNSLPHSRNISNKQPTKMTIEDKNKREKESQVSNIKINKVSLSNFRFYNGFNDNNIFEPNGKNMLIYGENGSGKSSLFKAFDFLSKTKIDQIEFIENKNIFDNDTEIYLEFEFDNEDTLKIEKDNLELTDDYNYIKNLSIFKPILDYKNLLKVHYQTDKSKEEVNIYDMLKELFKDYPIEDGKVLSDIESPKDYFDRLEEIINDKFFDDINSYLKVFDDDFKIDKFHFDMSFTDDGKVEFIVNLKIDFNDNPLLKYHLFLNEAKLTSLAISIYFSIIKNISDLLDNNSLKILILDDLLISLDMSNRLNLIDLIKQYFTDFQIFFFTHDKGLFETFKDRMDWKSYEIYVDKSEEGFEIPFVKKSQSLLEQSKYQKLHKNFDCSANLLRQCTEKLMCKFLPSDKLVSKNCKNLDLCALIDNGISFENNKENIDQDIVDMLTRLQTYRQILFNIGSHYDDTNIYKRELAEAIDILEKLKIII